MSNDDARDTPLTDDARWAAVAACDPAFDARFLYGVATTGVFCRPSCPSRTPRRENVVYFADAQEAQARGYRPCKRCRPDLPAFDPSQALVDQARRLLDAHVADLRQTPAGLAARLNALGISRDRLERLFRAREGRSIRQHLTALRLDKARELLTGTDLPIAAVALDCGFESLSNFYKRFREHTGQTPARFRREDQP